MFRKVPFYLRLNSVGDNVHIATNVLFVTHNMLNKKVEKRNIKSLLDVLR